MKIAVQLFGHLRTYDKCYKALQKNLLDLYDCDVFMHTWDKLDHNTKSWHTYHVDDKGQSAQEIEGILQNCYQPKLWKIETQVVKDEGHVVSNGNQISLFGIKAMLYSMGQANALRERYQQENNIQYDYVLVLRPDILLQEPLKIEEYAEASKTQEMAIYCGGFYKNKYILNDFRFVGANDVLFWGTPETISHFFKNTEQVIDQIKNPETTQYGPEYSIFYAINSMGIKTFLTNYLLHDSYEICRGAAKKVPILQIKKKKRWLRIHFNLKRFEILIWTHLKYNVFDFNLILFHYHIRICLGESIK